MQQRRRRNYAVGEIRNRFTRHFHHFHRNPFLERGVIASPKRVVMNSRPGNKTASHSEDLAPHEAKKDKKVCDYPIGYWHSDLHSAISTTEKQIPKWNLLQISAA